MPGPGFFFIDDEEERELLDVIQSRNLTRYRFDGAEDAPPTKTFLFEREMETRLRARHCVAVNSGTSALITSLMALGIQPGDEIIVPGYTFIASLAAIIYARGVPVLAEIDESLTIDPNDVERKITDKTRAIMAVHMLGAPCQMDALKELSGKYGIAVVEDVAQACGASFRGQCLGTWGEFGAFSLNVFKTITAGDGGFLTTNDDILYKNAFAFHDHGFAPLRMAVTEMDGIFGLNLRMAEFTGAVALAQGRKLARVLETTRQQKKKLLAALGKNVPHARRRVLNDEDGEAATVLVFIFDTAEQAARVAKAIGSKVLEKTGRHYYGNMLPLLKRSLPYKQGCPFHCPSYPTQAEYRPGLLPRTDDILSRSVALGVGLEDSYLGTSFGIGAFSSDEDIAKTSALFLERLKDCFN